MTLSPTGPGFDSWHVSFRVSYYKGENPNDAAATYLIFVNYILDKLLVIGKHKTDEIVQELENVWVDVLYISNQNNESDYSIIFHLQYKKAYKYVKLLRSDHLW